MYSKKNNKFKNVLKRTLVFLGLFSFTLNTVNSQIGGSSSYQFLDLASSSRIQGLGGSNISIYDKDANLTISNPALLDSIMTGSMSVNYMNYMAGVNFGYSSYVHHFNDIGTFNATFMYANYGDFIRANETGEITGDFVANDLAFIIGYGRKIDSSLSIGANMKVFNSVYDVYSSSGMAFDLAATYFVPEKYFAISAVIKNIGFKFKEYTKNQSEKLPFEIQLGSTVKLKHAPIRFSINLTHLQKWDLTYLDPTAEKQFDPETFEELPPEKPNFLDKAFRHVVFGTEILLSKNFHLQVGFNYRRRRELQVTEKTGLVGFSTGLAFRIKKFNFNYSLASYHLGGTSHRFSITSNIHRFRGK